MTHFQIKSIYELVCGPSVHSFSDAVTGCRMFLLTELQDKSNLNPYDISWKIYQTQKNIVWTIIKPLCIILRFWGVFVIAT